MRQTWKTMVYELAIAAFKRVIYDPTIYGSLADLIKGAVDDLLDEREKASAREQSENPIRANAPMKYHTPYFDQVITQAIAEGAPAYDLTIAGDPIAEYLPEGVLTMIRHRSEPDRIGVIVCADRPVTYRSHGTIRFLTSLQTETTEGGQKAQLARLRGGYRG